MLNTDVDDAVAAKAPRVRSATAQGEPGAHARPSRALVALSRLPLPLLYMAGRMAVGLALLLMRSRRQIILDNLAAAFPDSRADWRRRQLRLFAHNLADVVSEIVKGFTLTSNELRRRVRITNPELLDRYARAGQSIMLLGSHDANWDWVFLSCSEQLPFDTCAVYARLGNTRIDDFLYALRTRFGARLHTRQEFPRELIAGRHRLRAISLIVDGRPLATDEAHWVRFLHQDTAFRSRFETLARLWKYPVIYAARRRAARGHYEVTFEVLGEPPYDSLPFALVERYAESLQRSINANPADWLWTQRRWAVQKPFYH